MTIAITGITGLIGRHVAAMARARGHNVIGFTRHPDSTANSRYFGPDSPPDISGCDAILNLAGENVVGLWTSKKCHAIRESRVMGTRRIVDSIRASPTPPRVLVNASAIGIYGDTADTATDETGPHGVEFLADVCEAWESEALRAQEFGTRVVFLRTGVVLSPEGGALAAMLPIFRLGLGGKLGTGRQWISWIHIHDEAALALAAIENDAMRGPINATAPNPVRNADYTKALASAVHRPAPFWVPALALKMAAGGFSAELLESKRILPTAASNAGFQFQFPHLEDALADLLKKP